ncbi:peptidylprolyl isomerase, partial [bacterium]|nr:peptidylprolyl isomerase [bacterium]
MSEVLSKMAIKSQKKSTTSMLKKLISYFVPAALAMTLLAGGCAKKSGEIVGKAGKMVITAQEFEETMLKRYRSVEFAEKRSLKDRKELAEQIAENKLKLQDAYAKGIDKDSLVVAKADEVRKQSAIQDLYKVEILDKVIPPEAIQEEYDKTAEEIHAKHILFKSYTDMEPNELEVLKERAEKCYALLQDGADFDSLAKNMSEDVTTAQQGGDLGYFTWGKMVDEFQETAFKLKPGEMSDIVQSSYGFHIIKLLDRRPSETRQP